MQARRWQHCTTAKKEQPAAERAGQGVSHCKGAQQQGEPHE